MPSIYYELRNYKNRRGEQAIRLVIIHGDKTIRRNTDFSVDPKHWDNDRKRVKRSHPNFTEINDSLEDLLNSTEKEIVQSKNKGELTNGRLLSIVDNKTYTFSEIAEKVAEDFESKGGHGTAAQYRSVAKKLGEYKQGLKLEDITPLLLHEYKQHLAVKLGNSHNTIKANFNKLRGIYKFAQKMELIPKSYDPFADIELGGWKSGDKKTLTLDEIHELEKTEFEGGVIALAKDMFLFSFYAAGMRFYDVLTLKWSNIKKDRITYTPSKSKSTRAIVLSIPIHPKLQAILDKYKDNENTIFGQITEKEEKAIYRQVGNKEALINRFLQNAIYASGIKKKISFHCARHTFAQIANEVSNRNVYGIKSALGHGSISTTEIYLGNDTKAADELLKQVYG